MNKWLGRINVTLLTVQLTFNIVESEIALL